METWRGKRKLWKMHMKWREREKGKDKMILWWLWIVRTCLDCKQYFHSVSVSFVLLQFPSQLDVREGRRKEITQHKGCSGCCSGCHSKIRWWTHDLYCYAWSFVSGLSLFIPVVVCMCTLFPVPALSSSFFSLLMMIVKEDSALLFSVFSLLHLQFLSSK